MGPTDVLFISLLLTATAGAGAVICWRWRRWKTVRRAVAIAVVQLLVVVSVASLVNLHERFYATWSDVLDLEAAPVPASTVVSKPGPSSSAVPDLSAAQRAADRRGAFKGRTIRVTLPGRRTGYRFPALVYLPGSYFDPTQAARRFPVVELLVGYPGEPRIWRDTLRFETYLGAEIAAGRAPAMIGVMPVQNPAPPADSECVGSRAGTYLGADVPDAITRLFRVRQDRAGWAIMGYSTGGFCAANLSLQPPARFRTAVALSGYFEAITDPTTGDLYGGDKRRQRAQSPLWMVARPHQPVDFLLFTGTSNPHDHDGAHRFAAAIKHPPDGVTLMTRPGGHSMSLWRAAQPDVLRWLGQRLS